MSYIYVSPLGVIQETKELENLLNNIVLNSANEPELEYQLGDKSLFGRKRPKLSPAEKARRIKKASLVLAKWIIGLIIDMLVIDKLEEFTIQTIEKTKYNSKLYDFINDQIQAVYKKHPEYTSCDMKTFKQSNIYELLRAHFEDKTKKQKLKIITLKMIEIAIWKIANKNIKIPGIVLWVSIIKMILTYCGFFLSIGTLYKQAFEINGEIIVMGIILRPIGFVLSDLTLYSLKPGNKLIATHLDSPPEKLYQLTTEHAKQILARFKSEDIGDFKKEVARIYAGK